MAISIHTYRTILEVAKIGPENAPVGALVVRVGTYLERGSGKTRMGQIYPSLLLSEEVNGIMAAEGLERGEIRLDARIIERCIYFWENPKEDGGDPDYETDGVHDRRSERPDRIRLRHFDGIVRVDIRIAHRVMEKDDFEISLEVPRKVFDEVLVALRILRGNLNHLQIATSKDGGEFMDFMDSMHDAALDPKHGELFRAYMYQAVANFEEALKEGQKAEEIEAAAVAQEDLEALKLKTRWIRKGRENAARATIKQIAAAKAATPKPSRTGNKRLSDVASSGSGKNRAKLGSVEAEALLDSKKEELNAPAAASAVPTEEAASASSVPAEEAPAASEA